MSLIFAKNALKCSLSSSPISGKILAFELLTEMRTFSKCGQACLIMHTIVWGVQWLPYEYSPTDNSIEQKKPQKTELPWIFGLQSCPTRLKDSSMSLKSKRN